MTDSPSLGNIAITKTEFAQFQKLIFQIAGISMSDAKQVLLVGRLSKRLKELDFRTFGEYFRHVTNEAEAQERQTMVDLLTTNETYFFREPKHFDFLRERAASHRKGGTFRVWSAASSSGEEAYSMAMILAETLGDTPWEILGTDISTKVLAKAQYGQYPLERTDGIPINLLKKYCLKGLGKHAGTLLIAKELRQRVQFLHCNLMAPRHGLGQFDVIFLRNVMIYFESETKRKVIANLLPYLKRDGHFVVGHSESLNGLTNNLVLASPTIYRHAGAR
ncbi:CheR family methyltransferase [Dechloromonas denitrificans]|uniref:CheR family methyltransferase n=1 Tax=Dechloromonas denitrificans TaxID=281362 RepID=UPI001CFABA75|nr:protein-glutamate O-methyltransferase CheR [Dechloromonas denitrificans]